MMDGLIDGLLTGLLILVIVTGGVCLVIPRAPSQRPAAPRSDADRDQELHDIAVTTWTRMIADGTAGPHVPGLLAEFQKIQDERKAQG